MTNLVQPLADIAGVGARLRPELERARWLVNGTPPDDLEPLVTTWGSAVARIVVSVRAAGRTTTIASAP